MTTPTKTGATKTLQLVATSIGGCKRILKKHHKVWEKHFGREVLEREVMGSAEDLGAGSAGVALVWWAGGKELKRSGLLLTFEVPASSENVDAEYEFIKICNGKTILWA